MNRNMRTYFYAILGAIGGLIGWQVSGLLGLSFVGNLLVSEMIVGALVGFCIGLFIGVTEGLIARNPVQAGRAGLIGGLLGLVAGAIGLPLSEMIFQLVGAGILGRALGWGVFGTLLGLAQGVIGQAQLWKGASVVLSAEPSAACFWNGRSALFKILRREKPRDWYCSAHRSVPSSR